MSGAPSLTPSQALALRLAGQGLQRRAPAGELVRVCGAMCGAQAQVGTAARLSLAARVEGVTDAALVAALLEERRLVKTWTVRGTLHVIPAHDLALYVAALGPLRRESALRWLARSGVSGPWVERLSDDIVEALADGPLTRREIAARVGEAHGPRARRLLEHSWGGVFHLSVNEGRVCFGPAEGSRITFARVDRWLGRPLPAIAQAEAEAELARRFVRAYGPVSVRDFAYWAGIYAPPAQHMWERIAGELRPVTVDGKGAWVHAAEPLPRRGVPAAPVRLLPHFDAFLLGHRDKAAVLDAPHYKKVFRNAGWISPVVLSGGRVAGTWGLERGTRGHVARVAAIRPLTAAERAGVEGECERLARFLGEEVRPRYGRPARAQRRVAWTGP